MIDDSSQNERILMNLHEQGVIDADGNIQNQ